MALSFNFMSLRLLVRSSSSPTPMPTPNSRGPRRLPVGDSGARCGMRTAQPALSRPAHSPLNCEQVPSQQLASDPPGFGGEAPCTLSSLPKMNYFRK